MAIYIYRIVMRVMHNRIALACIDVVRVIEDSIRHHKGEGSSSLRTEIPLKANGEDSKVCSGGIQVDAD